MDDQPTPPPVPNEPGKNHDPDVETLIKIISLLVAFVPSLVALSMFSSHSQGGPATGWGLLILTAACCIGASIGIVRGMKNLDTQVGFALCLSMLFFSANVMVVVFVGCSQMSPI